MSMIAQTALRTFKTSFSNRSNQLLQRSLHKPINYSTQMQLRQLQSDAPQQPQQSSPALDWYIKKKKPTAFTRGIKALFVIYIVGIIAIIDVLDSKQTKAKNAAYERERSRLAQIMGESNDQQQSAPIESKSA